MSPIPGFANWCRGVEETKLKTILGKLNNEDISFLKSLDLKLGDSRIIKNKEAITKLVAHYIVNEKKQTGTTH